MGGNNNTARLLAVVKVDHVVWVDDDFAPATPDLIAETLEAMYGDGCAEIAELVANFPFLSRNLRWERGSLYDAIEEQPSDTLEAISSWLIGNKHLEPTPLTVLAEHLRGTLGKITLKTVDFDGWQREKSSLLTQRNSMYLVDFENGKGGISGVDVLEDILTSSEESALSVVLTNTCFQNEEINKGKYIEEKLRVEKGQVGRISVMAKARLNEAHQNPMVVDEAFNNPLRRICVRRITHHVAQACCDALSEGLRTAVETLSEIPINDVEEAVFARTWSEGGSELDVMSRILAVSGRTTLHHKLLEALKLPGANFFKELEVLRELSAREPVEHAASTDSRLKAWRKSELFDEGELLNRLHYPIECGDIFEKHGGGLFVLVGAPCDLMVRGQDAKRQASEGIFLPLRTRSTEQAGATQTGDRCAEASSGSRRYVLPSVGDDENYEVRFNDAFTVNLRVLDWCVLNPSGEVKVGLAKAPRYPGVLQVGWHNRLRDAHQACCDGVQKMGAVPAEYATLCFFPEGFSETRDQSAAAIGASKQMDFKLKRVKRLRPPYSDALLAAYLADAGRHGFEHDFAKRTGN